VLNDYILAFFIVVASSQILPLISQFVDAKKSIFLFMQKLFRFLPMQKESRFDDQVKKLYQCHTSVQRREILFI